MNTPVKIGVLVVSYRNNPELTTFLQHLAEFPTNQISCIVAIANGLDRVEAAALSAASSVLMPGRLLLIAGSQNPGYFGGAALGLREMQAAVPMPDWVIVTNDDIRYNADFFAKLADIPTDNIGVLAPDIVVPATGLHQNPLYVSKPPAYRIRLLQWLHRHLVVMRVFVTIREVRQFWRRRSSLAVAPARQAIYAPHGSCIVFNRRYFEAGGNLDYPCFLYGEEFFVAENVRRLNLSVYMEPNLCVTHNEHSTTGMLANKSVARYVSESFTFLLREYYSE
jgi:GT2 family glycosyltransferase